MAKISLASKCLKRVGGSTALLHPTFDRASDSRKSWYVLRTATGGAGHRSRLPGEVGSRDGEVRDRQASTDRHAEARTRTCARAETTTNSRIYGPPAPTNQLQRTEAAQLIVGRMTGHQAATHDSRPGPTAVPIKLNEFHRSNQQPTTHTHTHTQASPLTRRRRRRARPSAAWS